MNLTQRLLRCLFPLLTPPYITAYFLLSVPSFLPHWWASWLKLLVICLTLTQMEMSGLFLAATRDSRQWPSYAPGFLNIQLECGEVAAGVSVCENECMCESDWERERLSGHCQHRHHDPSHLGTANWQLISRIDSVVRSQVPAPPHTPPNR